MAVTAAELLDRATVGREVGTMVALCLIRCNGGADKALDLLADLEGLQPPEGDELDCVTIAAQAIRDAVAMNPRPQSSGEA